MDGAYAAVRFPTAKDLKEGKEGKEEDGASVLQDCRLMRVEDLQVLKSTATSRAPDCFQRTPKRIAIPDAGQLMALTVDVQGTYLFKYFVIIGRSLSYHDYFHALVKFRVY